MLLGWALSPAACTKAHEDYRLREPKAWAGLFRACGRYNYFWFLNRIFQKFYFRQKGHLAAFGDRLPPAIQGQHPPVPPTIHNKYYAIFSIQFVEEGLGARRQASSDWHSTWRQNRRRFAPPVLPQVQCQRVWTGVMVMR